MNTVTGLDRLACTNEELIFLAGLSGAKAVIGVEDPLRGRPTPEVEQALIAARERLVERRWLVPAADGSLETDPDVRQLVDTIVHAQHSYFAFLATASAADAVATGERRVFHVREPSVVSMRGDAHEVEVQRLANGRAIAEAVLTFWGVAEQPPAGAAGAVLPQKALHEAASLAAEQGERACRERLLAEGVEPDAAEELAITLHRPRRNAALMAFAIDAPPGSTLAMGMLEGANGMWRLRPEDDRDGVAYVRVVSCGGPTVASLIREFIDAT